MASEEIELKAKMFLYDLRNSALEHWFKADEAWEVSLANDDEKIAIEKKYHPTLSVKVLPEILAEMFGLVNGKPIEVKSEADKKLENSIIRQGHFNYLIAFNPKRQRS